MPRRIDGQSMHLSITLVLLLAGTVPPTTQRHQRQTLTGCLNKLGNLWNEHLLVSYCSLNTGNYCIFCGIDFSWFKNIVAVSFRRSALQWAGGGGVIKGDAHLHRPLLQERESETVTVTTRRDITNKQLPSCHANFQPPELRKQSGKLGARWV